MFCFIEIIVLEFLGQKQYYKSYKGFVAFLYQNMLLYWLGCYRLKFLKTVACYNISPDTINCIRLEKNNAKPYELVDTNRDNLNIYKRETTPVEWAIFSGIAKLSTEFLPKEIIKGPQVRIGVWQCYSDIPVISLKIKTGIRIGGIKTFFFW